MFFFFWECRPNEYKMWLSGWVESRWVELLLVAVSLLWGLTVLRDPGVVCTRHLSRANINPHPPPPTTKKPSWHAALLMPNFRKPPYYFLPHMQSISVERCFPGSNLKRNTIKRVEPRVILSIVRWSRYCRFCVLYFLDFISLRDIGQIGKKTLITWLKINSIFHDFAIDNLQKLWYSSLF